jgi:hypothetical protein
MGGVEWHTGSMPHPAPTTLRYLVSVHRVLEVMSSTRARGQIQPGPGGVDLEGRCYMSIFGLTILAEHCRLGNAVRAPQHGHCCPCTATSMDKSSPVSPSGTPHSQILGQARAASLSRTALSVRFSRLSHREITATAQAHNHWRKNRRKRERQPCEFEIHLAET